MLVPREVYRRREGAQVKKISKRAAILFWWFVSVSFHTQVATIGPFLDTRQCDSIREFLQGYEVATTECWSDAPRPQPTPTVHR